MPIVVKEDRPVENVDFQLSKGTLVHGTIQLSGDVDDVPDGASKPNVFMGLDTKRQSTPISELWRLHPSIAVGFEYPQFRDGKGKYAFRVERGQYLLRLQLPGDLSSEEPRRLSVDKQDEIPIDFDRSMPSNRRLQFRTVCADDPSQTVPNVVIRYDAYRHWAWVGEFCVTGISGECTRTWTSNEQFLRGRTKNFRLGGKATIDGQVTSVTIPMAPTATVRGRFVDGEGNPAADKKVEIVYRPETERRLSWQRDNEIAVRTDRSGRFEMPGLIPGVEYRINLVDRWQWKKGKPTNGAPVKPKPGEIIDLGQIVPGPSAS